MRRTVASVGIGSLTVVGFLLAALVLAWVPLWQVPVFGYATWFFGLVSLVALFFVAMAGGPNMFLGMTLASIVLNIVMVWTGVHVGVHDAAFRQQGDNLMVAAHPESSAFGHLYPGWWQNDVVVAHNVRGRYDFETKLPQAGELNTLTLTLRYSWQPETYKADLLRSGAVDYATLTKRELDAAVADVLSRYNRNRPYREDEVVALQGDILITFCSRMAVARADVPCPTLKVELTYQRGNQAIKLTM